MLGEVEGGAGCGTFMEIDLEDLRDDFAGLLHEDGIAGADVFAGNFVLVVESGAGDGGACELDRFENCNRSDRASATNLQADFLEQCLGLFSFKLICDGPAGSFGGETGFFLELEIVEFDDGAIGWVGELLTKCIQFFDTAPRAFDAIDEPVLL